MSAEAYDLVRRVRVLQQRRHTLAAAKDRDGAVVALDLAVSLVDAADVLLREALLHATNPAHTPPIPVVLGSQDVAAVVGADELMALVRLYATACVERAQNRVAAHAVVKAYGEVEEAVERLCAAAPTVELGGGRSA